MISAQKLKVKKKVKKNILQVSSTSKASRNLSYWRTRQKTAVPTLSPKSLTIRSMATTTDTSTLAMADQSEMSLSSLIIVPGISVSSQGALRDRSETDIY
jgi:hypothetical protein